MDHLTIANFKFGLDTRRSELTSQPGSLVMAENGHINQGAQFEKRKAFVLLGQLPVGTFGLQETPTGLTTFGSADGGTIAIPAGLTALVSYQRLRHFLWQLDPIAPQLNAIITSHFNPNTKAEPAMTAIVCSCTFGGKPFAVASFGSEVTTSPPDFFDDLQPITTCYYAGSPVLSSIQGLNVLGASNFTHTGFDNRFVALLATYIVKQYIGDTFQIASSEPDNVGTNITGPLNSPFAITVSDTFGGMITTSQITAPSAPVVAVSSKVTIYFTKGSAGSIDTLTGPNVVNGVVSGAVNLLPSGAVPFAVSLYQTAVNVATAINNAATGYTAQAQLISTTVAGLVISAPAAFGSVPNTNNISIKSTTILLSASSLPGSGTAGASSLGTYILSGGVTATSGSGQVQTVLFNQSGFGAGAIPQGTFEINLVFNNLTTTLGAGYLTRKRATFTFFLIAGAAGSVDSIVLSNGISLLSGAVAFNTNLLTTTEAIVNNINAKWGGAGVHPASPGNWAAYLSSVGTDVASGNVVFGVTVLAPTFAGESLNGDNNVTVASTTILVGAAATDSGLTNLVLSMKGGNVDPTCTVSLGGKLYLGRGSLINFSAIYNAARYELQDVGAGFVQNVDQDTAPTGTVALCQYQGRLAAFSRRNISIWTVNADPAQYAVVQNLKNIGTDAALSVQGFGELDTLFLSDTGIRSLRVRDSALNAYVVDVGSPIDSLIQTARLAGNSSSACSILEPTSNRYWLYLNGTIYVLSDFPSLKIAAWSTYTPTYITDFGHPNASDYTYVGLTIGRKYYFIPSPDSASFTPNYSLDGDRSFIATSTTFEVVVGLGGDYAAAQLSEATPFTPAKFLVYNGQVYVYTTDRKVLVYGGANNNTYDGSVATIELPWLDLKTPFSIKQGDAVNVAMEGRWDVFCGLDPRGNTLIQVVPNNSAASGDEEADSTFDEGTFGVSQQGTHYKFKAYSDVRWAQAASMSAFTLQYSLSENQ